MLDLPLSLSGHCLRIIASRLPSANESTTRASICIRIPSQHIIPFLFVVPCPMEDDTLLPWVAFEGCVRLTPA